MARTPAEYALGRVLAWLRWSGVPHSPEMARLALLVVEQSLADGEANLIGRVMEELPRRIALPEIKLPPAALPVKRVSLGYAPYL